MAATAFFPWRWLALTELGWAPALVTPPSGIRAGQSFSNLTRLNTAALWLRLLQAKILVSAEIRLCLTFAFSRGSLCWSESQLV